MLDYEDKAKAKGFRFIIGIDEAGRGPLAGPVVASAVSLKSRDFQSKIGDSKKLTPKQRLMAYEEIFEKAHVGVGVISEIIIDQVNILNATYLAMNRAVIDLLSKLPEYKKGDDVYSQSILLIDGPLFKSQIPITYQTIVGGDSECFSIACASIVAKVSRDRMLEKYDTIFPQYGFKGHKGYGTKQHREAIKEYGYSPIHRRSFTVK